MNKNEKLDNLRHSAAHLLAQAVLELFPGTKLTIGPTTQTGFFYDFLPATNFKEVLIPRDNENKARKERLKNGIPINDKTWNLLIKMADR